MDRIGGYRNHDDKTKKIIENFKRSLELKEKEEKMKRAQAKALARAPPEETYISYTDIIANIVKTLNIPDTVIGKRKAENEDMGSTLVQLKPIINDKYNIAAKRIYFELIMERPLWPRWMKKWAAINADPIHTIINNNTGNKLIYNLLHKVKKKLITTSHLAIMNQTSNTKARKYKVHRRPKEIKSIMPIKSNSLTVKQRRMTKSIANNMRLLLEHYRYYHPSDTWKGREPFDYELKKGEQADKTKNAAGKLAINSRRETWKRRKRKAYCD
jgi:hypothetical protein